MEEKRVTYSVLMDKITETRLETKGDLAEIKNDIKNLSKNIECNFVSKQEFVPVKQDVESLQSNWRYIVLTVATILIGSIMALILK